MRLLSVLKKTFGQLKLRELSTLQKLYAAMIAITCCLVFYAVGIITDFFASPMFSMFFIISYDTAHNIVSYIALAIAAGLCITALATSLLKKGKVALLKPEDTYVCNNTTSYLKADVSSDDGGFTCRFCGKTIGVPTVTLEYRGSKPRLVRHCPHCERPIGVKQKAKREPTEEIFVDIPTSIETEQSD